MTNSHYNFIVFLNLIRSQMINQEDYTMIADYDCMGVEERGKILEQKGDQVIELIWVRVL